MKASRDRELKFHERYCQMFYVNDRETIEVTKLQFVADRAANRFPLLFRPLHAPESRFTEIQQRASVCFMFYLIEF